MALRFECRRCGLAFSNPIERRKHQTECANITANTEHTAAEHLWAIRTQSLQWAGQAGLDTVEWAAAVQAAESKAVQQAQQMHALHSNKPKRFVKQHPAFVQHCGGSIDALDGAALLSQLEYFLFGTAMAEVSTRCLSKC